MMLLSAFAVLVIAFGLASTSARTADSTNITLPSGAVYLNPIRYNVVGPNYTEWRTNNSLVGFNPTNTTPPFIQAFDLSFANVTGPNATIRPIVSNSGFAFAHGAPIYVPDINVIVFASNPGGNLGYSGWNNNSVVSLLNLTQVSDALASNSSGANIQIQTLNLSNTIQMVTGGTGPYKGSLLFVTSGRALAPPSVVLVNPSQPYNSTVLLDNFFGMQFNSLEDVKVLPGTDIIFFTDPAYGYLNGYRPQPMLPEQVYRFDPSTGQVRVVADQFVHPNGIAFTPDGKTVYVSDTGQGSGLLRGPNQTLPATIYQFDVDNTTQVFTNRRVFAYSDSDSPHGIQLDTHGNVYSGCGDGTHVWTPNGTLIGKFFFNNTAAEMTFTNAGLVIFDEEKIYLANITARGIDLSAH